MLLMRLSHCILVDYLSTLKIDSVAIEIQRGNALEMAAANSVQRECHWKKNNPISMDSCS